MQIETKSYNAGDIIKISDAKLIGGNFLYADKKFQQRCEFSSDLSGCGLYACLFDQKLIYIGKFLGRRQAPDQGNVIDLRWTKHLATLTMRGRRVSLSAAPSQKVCQLGDASLVTSIRKADPNVLSRDRGCVSTYNRVRFALANWDIFERIDQDTLRRFTFIYSRVAALPPLSGQAIIDLRRQVSAAEELAVGYCMPKCNAVVSEASESQGISAEQIKVLFENILKDINFTVGTNNIAKNVHQSRVVVKNIKRNVEREPEDSSDGAMFSVKLETAPSKVHDFITRIRSHYEAWGDVELHHTKIPDLRLRIEWRPHEGKASSQNFATLQWQNRDKKILMQSYLSPDEMREFGVLSAKDVKHGPLKSSFRLSPSFVEAKADGLMRSLDLAATRLVDDKRSK